jgi:hypothetical protein
MSFHRALPQRMQTLLRLQRKLQIIQMQAIHKELKQLRMH